MSLDFTKFHIQNINSDTIRSNYLLPFEIRNVTEDGELITYLSNGKIKYKTPYSVAYFKGLEIRSYVPSKSNTSGLTTLEGSLHKYWNNGAHNYNDFKIESLEYVINDLKTKFNITPENLRFKQLEIGVNINTPYTTKALLKACIMHKKKPFKAIYTPDEGEYIQCRHSQYTIKIYDKRMHYEKKGFNVGKELLRFEIKFEKMERINKLGIYTLDDLLNYELINLKSLLLTEWNNVLFYDTEALDNTKYQYKYNNPIFWEGLTSSTYKYHVNNLKKLTGKNNGTQKKQIANLINKKYEYLNTKTVQIDPLYIVSNRAVSNLHHEDENRRFCKVTGLNISMQKSNSFLLSHTGLRYYLKTDKKVYKEVKMKYLSSKWKDADLETQITEIAHNIRNTDYNSKIKQQRLYPNEQINLFEIAI